MKRREFVNLWCSVVRKGRRRRFPDISPAEEAASVWSDSRVALRLWRRYRLGQANDERIAAALEKGATG